MLRHLVDRLATRIGIVVAIGSSCVICLGAGLYFQIGANRLLAANTTFRQHQLRDTFVTMSDVARLNFTVQQARLLGELTPDLENEMLTALDILYVRAEDLTRREDQAKDSAIPPAPSAPLFAIVEYVDAAIADGITDISTFEHGLLQITRAARAKLVTYLDNVRRLEDQTLDKQSAEVLNQARVVGAAFAILAIFMTGALILLRREILTRQARDRAERRADYLAYFDPLTDLPNRVQFTERVDQRLAKNMPTTLVMVDLDGFKAINDTHGHAAGDAVLIAVGKRLREAAAAQGGFAARLSGDEFAICLPVEAETNLQFVADGILETIALPVHYEAEELNPKGSIGGATRSRVAQGMGPTFSNMLRAADFALYVSKDDGKNRFTLYDAKHEAKLRERRGLMDALPDAIASKALDVYLQPKVILPDARTYGFEALVRWRHQGKFISPDIFIGLAEEAGLVTEIDHYVLFEATKILAQSNARSGLDLSVSVNLSALHFNTGSIVDNVEKALAVSGLPPKLLTLEVTETVQIQDWGRVGLVLSKISELGCKISIDDFGSGYSSLAYLRNMAADEIKIDRSLIIDIATSEEPRHVLKAIYELGRGLDMQIVVEGIEDHVQSAIIHGIGCKRAQGFLFGKPSPAQVAINRAVFELLPDQRQRV